MKIYNAFTVWYATNKVPVNNLEVINQKTPYLGGIKR